MAQLNDISIYRGEAITLTFTMSPATDITGWNINFTTKTNKSDSASVFASTGALTNSTGGIFTIGLTHAQTNRAPGTYYYDVQRIDGGSEAVLSIGKFEITQEVLY